LKELILCASGVGEVESINHMFVQSCIVGAVWCEINCSFGLSSVPPSVRLSHFLSFHFPLYLGRKGRKEEMMIWHAVVWVFWRARNDKIFSGWRASNLSHGCGFWLKWVVLHFFTMNGVLTQLIFSLDSSFLWVITIPVPTLISTYICG
jgi:hypothetical protein